ncbi:hypothetical protein D7Y11_31145 [Corallococcus sp. AB018]|uniref:hypothetical protein n=1 Tax=Corallococcus sp. AB018 TaxID=2316715 RepID=UPI000F87BCFF|nr:hypothetical protein [Corallococcus sp. AB018]RUO89271.1 hypothetical protein D7Y11_31145 [Corallococcus sp. AB018]
MTRSRSTPSPEERLQQFFKFCDVLEAHPFYAAHAGGSTLRVEASFPEDGPDTVEVNFDVFHLESLLGRLRQFLSDGELFFFKDVRREIISLFGDDDEFRSFYDKLVAIIGKPYPERSVQVFKANGVNVVAGFTFKQLAEAQLYTGPLHSDRLINPTPGTAEDSLPASHEAAKKHLVLDLAYSAIAFVRNILVLRNWAHRRARETGKLDLFPELVTFDARARAAGV